MSTNRRQDSHETAQQRELNKRRQDFYEGETWPYWIGPLPSGSTAADDNARLAVRKAFQRTNKVKECVDRIVNTLVAKPPHWTFEGDVSEAQTEQLNELLQDWFKSVWATSQQMKGSGNTPIWEAAKDLAVLGRGYLRLWMPARLRAKEGFANTMLSAVHPGSVSVVYDDDGFPTEYRVSTKTGVERHVLYQESPGADYLMQVYPAGNEAEPIDYLELEPGQWLVAELTGQSAIGQDVIDAQNAINLALTMQSRSIIQNGFVERILTNAQTPGEWIEDPLSPSGLKFVPAPEGLTLGPGSTTFLQGHPLTNDLGAVTGYTNPGVSYSQPVDIGTYNQAIGQATEIIYLSMGMGHLLAADTGQIAALSRQILQQDAEVRAAQYERAIVGALEQVLTVLCKLYGYDVRPTVELRKSGTFVSPEAKAQTIAEYNAGLLSKATAIARLGSVEDVDAELAQIETEDEANRQRGAQAAIEALAGAVNQQGQPGQDDPGQGDPGQQNQDQEGDANADET
jgi:hypothetical protein